MDQLIAASVVIGDRTYRIKMEPKDEEVVRHSVKTINDKIVEYKTNFAGKDMQDYIAMVLIWFATDKNAGGAVGLQSENVGEQLASIEKLLDAQL